MLTGGRSVDGCCDSGEGEGGGGCGSSGKSSKFWKASGRGVTVKGSVELDLDDVDLLSISRIRGLLSKGGFWRRCPGQRGVLSTKWLEP